MVVSRQAAGTATPASRKSSALHRGAVDSQAAAGEPAFQPLACFAEPVSGVSARSTATAGRPAPAGSPEDRRERSPDGAARAAGQSLRGARHQFLRGRRGGLHDRGSHLHLSRLPLVKTPLGCGRVGLDRDSVSDPMQPPPPGRRGGGSCPPSSPAARTWPGRRPRHRSGREDAPADAHDHRPVPHQECLECQRIAVSEEAVEKLGVGKTRGRPSGEQAVELTQGGTVDSIAMFRPPFAPKFSYS